VQALSEEDIKPELYWNNPNIHPYTEYRARRDALKTFAEKEKLALCMDDDYGLKSFVNAVENEIMGATAFSSAYQKEDSSFSRCTFCYWLRLDRTARYAAMKEYEAFSTTLLISPYQNHVLIRQTGEELAAFYGIEFLYRDFRPRFREGQNQARAASYYMQKYCGCIYSEEERYLGKACGAEASGGSQ